MKRVSIARSIWLFGGLAMLSAATHVAHAAGAAHASSSTDRHWALRSDNDLFAFAGTDRDYTAGVAVTLTGTGPWRASQSEPDACASAAAPCPLLPARAPVMAHALEIGMLLFTPEDLEAREPLLDDRPYASLFYASRSTLAHDALRDVAYQATLTVGLLGLGLAKQVHRRVHAALGIAEPAGYGHQVSAGGEPTARYEISRYRLLKSGRLGARSYAVRFDTGASVGYLTEVNAQLAFRWGSAASQWWEWSTEAGDYAGQPVISTSHTRTRARRPRLEVSAGLKARGRFYDAFWQGQFRSSDVAYAWSTLEHRLLEAWLGLDVTLRNDVRVSYVVRSQTKEAAAGRGARAFTWAGLSVTRNF